jgi:hypothetical protein
VTRNKRWILASRPLSRPIGLYRDFAVTVPSTRGFTGSL